VYTIPEAIFQQLYEQHDCFADFVEVEQTTRLRQAVKGVNEANDLTTSKVRTLLTRTAEPVASVMTPQVIRLDHNAYVYEAMLTMLRHNVHHLPILQGNRLLGIIEATDIVRYESQNSLLLVSRIFQQQSFEGLAQIAQEVKASFVRLVNEDANSHMVGSAMSVIGRRLFWMTAIKKACTANTLSNLLILCVMRSMSAAISIALVILWPLTRSGV